MYRIYISPHIDDAILSCGGRIFQQICRGEKVSIVSVFTETGQNVSSDITELYQSRRKEDLQASSRLGCKTIHLGELDAPFRSQEYKDFESIVFSDDTSLQVQETINRVASLLTTLIKKEKPDSLVAPLGVGGHIDHRIVFRACSEIVHFPCSYYEERPYAFIPGAVSHRWVEAGGEPFREKKSEHLMDNKSWERLVFLDNYMAQDKHADECMARLFEQADSLSDIERTANSWVFKKKQYNRSNCFLNVEQVNALLESIACYQSQVADLFLRAPETNGMTSLEAVEYMYGYHGVDNTGRWFETEWRVELSS